MPLIPDSGPPRRRRGPFLTPLEIAVLAGMVAALLFLLFPGRDFDNPSFLARPDQLSVAYLEMSLRGHPEQDDARLLLAQQQMALGRLDDARQTLARLRGRGDAMGQRAELLALNIDRARLNGLPAGDGQRQALQQELHRAAVALIPRAARIDDLADLGEFVLALGDPGQAARAYARLAQLDQAHAVGWLEKVGRWSYAAELPGQAARAYADAASLAGDPGEKTRLAREALTALLAANEGRAGLTVARPLVDAHAKDLGVLGLGVRLALAGGDVDCARRWGEQRIVVAGGSDGAVRDQIGILMQARDALGALKLARRLLQHTPNDHDLRRQAALLARWSAQPEEALKNWAWLALHGSEEARLNALELAQGLNDHDIESQMLQLRADQAVRKLAPVTPHEEPPRAPRIFPARDWPERRRPG
jgi:Tfp pilus assembly protein PilF